MHSLAPLSTRPPTRLILVGAEGRMGVRLTDLARDDPRFTIVARADESARSAREPRARPARDIDERADVVIDFSSPRAIADSIDLTRRARAALLVGTTGIPGDSMDLLRGLAREHAVLLAPNTSLGVAVVSSLVSRAASMLASFDPSIVEAHHSAKKDAPSGTALRLADAAARGGAGVRADQIVAIRGGDVVGEHTVRFAGPGEYIEITHRATSRDVFAHGALRAAAWLHDRRPGWHTIEDVLGLNP